MTPALPYAERPADGAPDGLLVLHHGRGSDECDLIGLADVLDPGRRLHVVAPRAPLALPGSPGHHWYVVPRVGFPDPATFDDGRAALGAFHDETWERTGIAPAMTVLGGFSQGSVMSYALGLDAGRPVPAGLLILSGFVPTAPGWSADLPSRAGLPVFIAHGRRDPVIDIGFGRAAQTLLSDGGAEVEYHESDGGHHVDPAQMVAARTWLGVALPATATG
jgi:phospholipase/carboxylesterase